jgi:hypothetical protein
LDTFKVSLSDPRQKQQVDAYILELLQKDSEGEHLFHITKDNVSPVFVINEGKLTDIEKVRLEHWRHAHRQLSGKRHDERCPACEQAKHKNGSFKRNTEFYGTGMATKIVYWRLYCDGYGGQRSMGVESYQGAKGGFVFVCPVSGMIKIKLYGTTKTIPSYLVSGVSRDRKRRICGQGNLRRYIISEYIACSRRCGFDVQGKVDTCKLRDSAGNGLCRKGSANDSTNVSGSHGRSPTFTTILLGPQ